MPGHRTRDRLPEPNKDDPDDVGGDGAGVNIGFSERGRARAADG